MPFRRRYEHLNYTPLFNNNSDEWTWIGITLFGSTQTLLDLRYGRADWGSGDNMALVAAGDYRVPDVITDLVTRDDGPINDAQMPENYFQVIRHEGVEVYSRSTNYLISAGGTWQDSLDRDSYLGKHGEDTNGIALATTLMPVWGAADRNDLIRLDGNSDPKARYNSCVAPNFACGLNPVIPDALTQHFRQLPRPCTHSVLGRIGQKWIQSGGENGVFGCPITDEAELQEGDGRFQNFERGEILWSRPQKMVMAAFYKHASNDIAVEWSISDQFTYDFFNVRWDKDGHNQGQWGVQHDDPNASRTGGNWTVPTNGFGKYRIVIEGCDGHLIGSSTCRQGFSAPIYLDLPSANSCTLTNGNWSFVDLTEDCGAPHGRGLFAAVYQAPCKGSNCRFGFFEAAPKADWDLDSFKTAVLTNNGGHTYLSNGVNIYTKVDGTTISFTPDHAADKWGIVEMGNQPVPTDMEQWRLAKGDIIDADGLGCVLVKNPVLKQALVLDLRNLGAPSETVVPLSRGLSCANIPIAQIPTPNPPAPLPHPASDICILGFVWREAIPADHVCVDPDTRNNTAADNAQAASRRDPQGGPFGPDTCLAGFVWRDAFPGDHVCVVPQTRDEAAADNAQAASRRVN